MKKENSPSPRRIARMIICFLLLGGCNWRGAYDYATIRSDYPDLVSPVPTLEALRRDDESTYRIPSSITLTEAVRIALASNPDSNLAMARIREAEASLHVAESFFYPRAGFYMEYLKGDAPSSFLFKKIDQRKLQPDTDFNEPGEIENFESGINVQWNLFRGGRDVLNRKIAETDITIADLNRRSVENRLVSSVIRSYYDILGAQEFIGISEESRKSIEEELGTARIRHAGGGALKSDVLSLETRLALAEEDVARARSGRQKATASLAVLLGSLSNDGMNIVPEEEYPIKVPEESRQGLSHAMEHHPEILRAREQVRQARISLDVARGAHAPQVDLASRYYLDDESLEYDRERENWNVALVMNWDIFSGFAHRAAVMREKARLEQALATDRMVSISIAQGVTHAYLDLEEAQARLVAAQTGVRSAEESFHLVKSQYEGGAATITRYLEAEHDWKSARRRETIARFDRKKALAGVASAIGMWPARNVSEPLEMKKLKTGR